MMTNNFQNNLEKEVSEGTSFSSIATKISENFYDTLSSIYDIWNEDAGINHEDVLQAFLELLGQDSDFSERFINENGYLKSAPKLLDMATGSGQNAFLLASWGFDVLAFDCSQVQLDLAKSLIDDLPKNRSLSFYKDDLLSLASTPKVDLATCFFDSLNHLESYESLERCFKVLKERLSSGGLFFFDVLNADYFETGLDSDEQIPQVLEGDDFYMVVYFEREGHQRIANVELFFQTLENEKTESGMSPLYERTSLRLTEQIFSHEEIEMALKNAGFVDIQRYDADVLLEGTSLLESKAIRSYYLAKA